MNYNFTIVLLWLLFVPFSILGQQEANLTLYRYNMNVLNPAVAGMNGETWINATFRRQWSDIAFSPETQAVSAGTPMGGNLGLGVSVVQDRTFIERQTGLHLDFSYRVRLGVSTELYLGLKAGGTDYSVNASGLETYNYIADASLDDIGVFNPNIGVGAYLSKGDFFISLSAPRLLTSERASDQEGVVTVAQNRAHIYLSSGYTFPISDNVKFSPSFLLRYVEGAPVSTDILAEVRFWNRLSVGASYRTDSAISGLFTLQLANRFVVGYAHESSLRTELRGDTGNTHELIFRFLLGKGPL